MHTPMQNHVYPNFYIMVEEVEHELVYRMEDV